MTALSLLPQQDARTRRGRLEVLTALINGPEFDPVLRGGLKAVTAVAQRRRRETGPHTELVLAEAMAPMCSLMEAFQPLAEAAAAAMAELGRALQPVAQQATGSRCDRPPWATPYGPPPRRR
ncbi:hypothetical protein OG243_01880 [Streptomyces sp. NBC_01318]|uniref:hypothetical protein n=1 Tax=Streptomyces sp. NBC_01318 TaxID=2903823 RepID=UPI002E131D5B|nr:hypothetical protein OG243_01880 [Streptomyces sp. NBC_01318]